jgi:SOS response regulatory protein OraA/RecX
MAHHLNRIHACLKASIEAAALVKLRRMWRQLRRRGFRFHQSDEVWIASSLREDNRSA